MWKSVYPISFLSTRWPSIWLGVHFRRDLCTWCFVNSSEQILLLKTLSNHKGGKQENKHRISPKPKPDIWDLNGDLFYAANYIVSHSCFSFLKWVRREENVWKRVLCAEGVVFAFPFDGWLINVQSCQDQFKVNHTKLWTCSRWREFKKWQQNNFCTTCRQNISRFTACEIAFTASAQAILECLTHRTKYDNNLPHLNKAKLASPTQTEGQNDWLPPGLWASMQA